MRNPVSSFFRKHFSLYLQAISLSLLALFAFLRNTSSQQNIDLPPTALPSLELTSYLSLALLSPYSQSTLLLSYCC